MADAIVHKDTLATVTANQITADFRETISSSVCKILALSEQAASSLQRKRYLSKNNANISRIDAVLNLFPTSDVLVIFRNPLAHISSLAKQHERFLQEHERDAFSRRYMKWIGHYEFGENFKPINFGGWLDAANIPSRIDTTFWMGYWNAAYAYALEHKTDSVHFVDFDRLLEDGVVSLKKISKSLALNDEDCLVAAEKTLRSPTTQPLEHDNCPPDVWDRAQNIHAQLKSLAI